MATGTWKGRLKSTFGVHWPEEPVSRARWVFYVLFYAVLVNIPYWFASREFGFFDRRGVFGMEFFAIGVIALFVRPALSALLLLAAITADMAFAISESYSIAIPEILSNMGAYSSFSGHRRLAAVGVVLLGLLVTAIAWILPVKTVRKSDRRRVAGCLVLLLGLTLTSDVLTVWRESGRFPNPLRRSFRADLVESSWMKAPKLDRNFLLGFVRGVVAEEGPGGSDSANAAPHPVPSATEKALEGMNLAAMNLKPGGLAAGDKGLPNVVIVLVESWGLANDAPLRAALTEPYANAELRARYQVVEGMVPFYGSTVAGEARELCGNSLGFNIMSAKPSDLAGCVPSRLAALGYDDISVHGMNGHLFRRSTWYTTIGFKEQWFGDQFKQIGLPECVGAFNGTCDADIARWIGKMLEESDPHPRFVHWMTLNSHLPVVVPAPLSGGAPCTADLGLSPRTPLCSWYQLVANVHQSVSTLAMGNLNRPTVFIVVGDHAPPFNEPAARDRFSQTDVPYLLLLPRAGN